MGLININAENFKKIFGTPFSKKNLRNICKRKHITKMKLFEFRRRMWCDVFCLWMNENINPLWISTFHPEKREYFTSSLTFKLYYSFYEIYLYMARWYEHLQSFLPLLLSASAFLYTLKLNTHCNIQRWATTLYPAVFIIMSHI